MMSAMVTREEREARAFAQAEAGVRRMCKSGAHDMLHPEDDSEIALDGRGKLYCRICKREQQSAYYAAHAPEMRREKREKYREQFSTPPERFRIGDDDDNDDTDSGITCAPAGIRRAWLTAAKDWMEDGACNFSDPVLFFGIDGEDEHAAARIAKAKQICQGCPVVNECREYALGAREKHGVWGGMTERERREAWGDEVQELIA